MTPCVLEILTDRVVDHLGLVLRGDAGDQALLLRLGDAEPVVGVLDVGGQVVPGGGLLLGRADEVLDVVEVDARRGRSPSSASASCSNSPQRPSAAARASTRARSSWPRCRGRRLGEAALRAGARDVGVGPAVAVATQGRECSSWVSGSVWSVIVLSSRGLGRCDGARLGRGTWVVQTPSPLAMVASRWTCVPSSRRTPAVSASHSSGNSAATCATGQWCWHICTPEAVSRVGSVALGGQAVASTSARPIGSSPRVLGGPATVLERRRPGARRTPRPRRHRRSRRSSAARRWRVVVGAAAPTRPRR